MQSIQIQVDKQEIWEFSAKNRRIIGSFHHAKSNRRLPLKQEVVAKELSLSDKDKMIKAGDAKSVKKLAEQFDYGKNTVSYIYIHEMYHRLSSEEEK